MEGYKTVYHNTTESSTQQVRIGTRPHRSDTRDRLRQPVGRIVTALGLIRISLTAEYLQDREFVAGGETAVTW
jgi:hypothetical protein